MSAREMRTISHLTTVATFTLVSLFASSANADDSAYCQKVRARAASDAALLYSPTVSAQAIRFPRSGAIDTGLYIGSGVQVRGVLTWSPLDFYRGFQVEDAAERDCARHEAHVSASQVLSVGVEYGRLPALRREAAYLEGRRAAWDEILKQTDVRLEQRVTSLLEANEVRARVAELARRHERIRGDIARLEALHVDEYRGKLGTLAERVEDTTMRYEAQVVHLRSLDAWTFSVSGGLVPHAEPVDWFGSVQVGFNFGAFSRNANDTKYIAARREELTNARYELRAQLRRFAEQISAEAESARRELVVAERKTASLDAVKKALAGAENAPNGPHALAVIDLEAMFAEAERTYLAALVTELEHLSHQEKK